MKRLIMISKNKEKGSVSLFVIVGSIFVLIILLLVNIGLINDKANQEKQINEISKIYSVNEDDLENAYKTASSTMNDYISRTEVKELIQQETDDLKQQLQDSKNKIQELESSENELKNTMKDFVICRGMSTNVTIPATTYYQWKDFDIKPPDGYKVLGVIPEFSGGQNAWMYHCTWTNNVARVAVSLRNAANSTESLIYASITVIYIKDIK